MTEAQSSDAGVNVVADLLGGSFPGHTMQRVRTPDGRYRYAYVSAGVRDSFGLDPEQLMQMESVDHRWILEEDRARFVDALEQSASGLTPLDVEVRVETSDGGYKWVRSIGRPRRLADGTVVWDGVALDVTDRREAVAALERALADARRNELAEGRFAYIAANDLRAPLDHLAASIGALDTVGRRESNAPRQEIEQVVTAFDAFQRALAATRELVASEAGHSEPLSENSPVAGLTRRQNEILEFVRRGASNREIATDLGISEGTVKLHVSAILKHLGVRNRTEAARH